MINYSTEMKRTAAIKQKNAPQGNEADLSRAKGAAVFFQNTTIHVLLIIIVGFIIYSNTFDVPFFFDDASFIYENPAIKDFTYFKNPFEVQKLTAIAPNFRLQFITRIVGNLTFALNYKADGLNVAGYHIVNLFIHIMNALLLYFLVRLTFQTPYFSSYAGTRETSERFNSYPLIALFSALLFVSHPVQTQAVTYITQRFASFVTTFFLFSLVFYVKYRLTLPRNTKWHFYAGSIASAFCAMLTKETAFTLPLIIVLYEFMLFDGNLRKRVLALMPIVSTIVILPSLMLITRDLSHKMIIHIEPGADAVMTRWDYLFTSFRVIVTYFRLLFYPAHQNLLYDYPVFHSIFAPAVLLSLFFHMGILGLGIYLFYHSANTTVPDRRKLRIVSFGILWFYITLSVESSIIKLDNLIYEHRLYLPLVGFCMLFTTLLIWFGKRRETASPATYKAIVSFLVLTVLVLSGVTYARNNVWRDGIGFWEDVVRKSPNKAIAHCNLAKFYEKNNRLEDAANEYRITIKLDPDFADAHSTLGVIYGKLGRDRDAETELRTALQLNPNLPVAHINMGVLYEKFGRIREALEELETAVKLDPYDAFAHANLGIIYAKQGHLLEARKELQTAMKLNPDLQEARKILQMIQ